MNISVFPWRDKNPPPTARFGELAEPGVTGVCGNPEPGIFDF